jgi:GNAT superfamily N-acetyltransferase
LILALPRSRTAWLSRFLAYGVWQCGHDELRHCRSLADVASWFAQPYTGTVETAAAPFWRLIPEGVRVATIRRPVDQVLDSLRRTGIAFDDDQARRHLQRLDRKLDQVEARLDTYSWSFDELACETSCAELFTWATGLPHDPDWWHYMAPANVQVSVPHMVRYMQAHGAQLDKLTKVAKHACLARLKPPIGPDDGVTFQVEPFRQFYDDAIPLFAEHLVQTDQAPDDYLRKNVELLQWLDDGGELQCLTARCNGRMFGYLMSVICQSLDAPGERHAMHTIFFASPTIPGLGMRLQRAAIAELRKRGVNELQMRASHRGSGPRLGTFYRRLGAEEFGQLYRLRLED